MALSNVRNQGVIRSQGSAMSCNIWKLMSPEALFGRKVHGRVSSKVLAATCISKIIVAGIRKTKDNEKGEPVSLSTPGELRLRKNNTVAAVENFMTSQEDLQI